MHIFEKFDIYDDVKYYTLDLRNVIHKICVGVKKKGEIEYKGPFFETLLAQLPALGFNVGVKHYFSRSLLGVDYNKKYEKETLFISHVEFI